MICTLFTEQTSKRVFYIQKIRSILLDISFARCYTFKMYRYGVSYHTDIYIMY